MGPGFRRALIILAIFFVELVSAGSFDDFFSAIRRDNPSKLIELALRGFDMNTRDESSEPPLIMALKLDAIKSANFLASAPSLDINSTNPAGENALMIGALRGHVSVVEILIDRKVQVNKPGWTPLHYAATNKGDVAPRLVRLMLEHHAYIDAASPNGTTPLMMAAQYGHRDVVKLLLEEGADPSLRNQQGLGAIEFALRADRPDVAERIAAAIRARQPRGTW